MRYLVGRKLSCKSFIPKKRRAVDWLVDSVKSSVITSTKYYYLPKTRIEFIKLFYNWSDFCNIKTSKKVSDMSTPPNSLWLRL